jgi:hypothetical protein
VYVFVGVVSEPPRNSARKTLTEPEHRELVLKMRNQTRRKITISNQTTKVRSDDLQPECPDDLLPTGAGSPVGGTESKSVGGSPRKGGGGGGAEGRQRGAPPRGESGLVWFRVG